ncbi:MAG: hypothetical protein ACSHXI_08255 [Hoeflea sp.]|uniref:hypothetical protein n=1 Tax=Hoeflea sp. TaxID=1940281 RepID=UPI003EF5A80B
MTDKTQLPSSGTSSLIVLGWYAIFGCLVVGIAVLSADFVVPNHDRFADTISDLGAGKYEIIVSVRHQVAGSASPLCAEAGVHFS